MNEEEPPKSEAGETHPMSSLPMDIRQIEDSLSIVRGKPDQSKLSLFAIVRNESFLIQAFLNHYRALGIEQFLILDDRSDDGTAEFLCEQPDCVVLSSSFSFGDVFTMNLGIKAKPIRIGVALKQAIPQKYSPGQYCVYADVDEFLFLPPGVSSIPELIGILSRNNIPCIAGSMVEFYPAELSGMSGSFENLEIRSLKDLLERYPYYDARQIVVLKEGKQPRGAHRSASTRLFRKFGIFDQPDRLPMVPNALRRYLPSSYRPSARQKTPIVKWTKETYLVSSHRANVPPPESALLAIGHFKFTHRLETRIEEAMKWQSYARSSSKYENYARLFQKMRRDGGNFLGRESRKFKSAEEFTRCGVAKWGLPLE